METSVMIRYAMAIFVTEERINFANVLTFNNVTETSVNGQDDRIANTTEKKKFSALFFSFYMMEMKEVEEEKGTIRGKTEKEEVCDPPTSIKLQEISIFQLLIFK